MSLAEIKVGAKAWQWDVKEGSVQKVRELGVALLLTLVLQRQGLVELGI